MSEKVVGLRGRPLAFAIGEPVPLVVDLLEWALAEAKSGNMRAVAMVWVIDDKSPSPLVGNGFEVEDGRGRHLDSAVHELTRRVERWIDE